MAELFPFLYQSSLKNDLYALFVTVLLNETWEEKIKDLINVISNNCVIICIYNLSSQNLFHILL